VQYLGHPPGSGPSEVSPWNRTWLKDSAQELARAGSDLQHPPLAATWRVGEGAVLATAFDAGPDAAAAFVKQVARPPHDPRFRVTWDTGPQLRVTVDAFDGQNYLNGENLTLVEQEQTPGASAPVTYPVPQTGPGRYELSTPAPRIASIATLRARDAAVDQIAVAGRYAPEFDAVGNDRSAMNEFARRTSGAVIEPRRTQPIDFHWPAQRIPLAPVLGAIGALFVALGLGYWRLK